MSQPTNDNEPDVDRIWLRDQLESKFSIEELKTLCFDLGISYENLPGSTKQGKARELVRYCERRGRSADLVAALRQQRPELWGETMTTQGDEQRQPSALAALEQRIATLEARGNASDAERIGELRRRYDRMVATLEGDGAIAQGGSISVAPGGIYIGGNFEGGQLVSGDKNTVGDGDVQSGGIRVGNITDSEKVKIGASVQGGSAADAVALTNAIMSGRITVGDITRSKDVNVGLRHITDPDNATLDELRQEVAALAEQLAAIRADDPLDETESEDAEEAAADLATVERELAKSEPSKGRILRKLESTTKVLTAGADAAEAGEKVGGYLIKLAPIAATLYQLAQKLLG